LTLSRVFHSRGGRAYHGDPNCRALESAQALWDGDDPDYPIDGPYNGGYPVVATGEERAYYTDAKRPCLVCLPGRAAPFKSAEDFGHRPEPLVVQGRTVWHVCAVCQIVHWRDTWELEGDLIKVAGVSPVQWPCASAIVLGLVEREPFVWDESLRMAA
jgi:hypothetical protein